MVVSGCRFEAEIWLLFFMRRFFAYRITANSLTAQTLDRLEFMACLGRLRLDNAAAMPPCAIGCGGLLFLLPSRPFALGGLGAFHGSMGDASPDLKRFK